MEIDFAAEIVERLEGGGILNHKNDDYVEG
jgi:hypothetical protein